MEISKLNINNIIDLNSSFDLGETLSIAGLSGSGKTSFCKAISELSLKKTVMILPKSEYRFLFPNVIKANYFEFKKMPLIFFLSKISGGSNPRSTVGTHTNIFKYIRSIFANKYHVGSEVFSFNNSVIWCKECKGRGSNADVTCKTCGGDRYSKNANNYFLEINEKKHTLIDFNKANPYMLLEMFGDLIPPQIKNILNNMIALNIGYISLDRILSTLSGGETVRLFLSEFMTYGKGCVVVVDELSNGLDIKNLINTLKQLNQLGKNNQIVFIDHSDIVINSAGRHIFFGPGSGTAGGKIVDKSPRPQPEYYNVNDEIPEEFYHFKNIQKRIINLNNFSVPKNRIVSVTGESGCGKSTLVVESLIPYLKEKYKECSVIYVEQDKNRSVTSRSTVATFLELKLIDHNAEKANIENTLSLFKGDKKKILQYLVDFGLGYLSFDRKIQTLSTGEFQCVYLISELFKNFSNEAVFIFDEPSKGLSQNILNNFIKTIRNILSDKRITLILIEHNDYILKNSDFIVDFGERKPSVSDLTYVPNRSYFRNQKKCKSSVEVNSNFEIVAGVEYVEHNFDNYFQCAENEFKGGVLRNISSTANWIYSDYTSTISPVVALDFEKTLYSEHTFLFELFSISDIVLSHCDNHDSCFNFFDKENLCECCKGTGKVRFADPEIMISNPEKGFWNGLFCDEIMEALKNYNYTKIKFLFTEIKKNLKYDLSKPYCKMSDTEKKIFLYGYWNAEFNDTKSKTKRKWRGIIFLIEKYMRYSKGNLNFAIKESENETICPMCGGNLLNHENKTFVHGRDIREVLHGKLIDAPLEENDFFQDLIKLVGENAALNSDVHAFSQEVQARLKLLEIKNTSFFGYHFVLKNTEPFLVDDIIRDIAHDNFITICGIKNCRITKKQLIEVKFPKKISEKSYVYELLGFSKISTEINKLRKQYPCDYCHGKMVLQEESIFENIDVTEYPCTSCSKTGISNEGLMKKIQGFTVEKWLLGTLRDVIHDIPQQLENINPCSRMSSLGKYELLELSKYLGR